MSDPQRILSAAVFLAAAGMWLLLPRGTRRGKLVGALLAGLALVFWASRLPRLQSWTGDAMFLAMAGVTVVSAAVSISLANPVYCAIWFGLSLAGTAGLFFYEGAQFLAVATLVVYAGAILVTFLFVLMLAQPRGRAYYDRVSWEALLSAATGAVMVGVLSMAVSNVLGAGPDGAPALQAPSTEQLQGRVLAPDHVARIGSVMFSRYLLAVEVAGILLLAALVGAAAISVQGRSPPERATGVPARPAEAEPRRRPGEGVSKMVN